MRPPSVPALVLLVLLPACTSVDPVARQTEKAWIAEAERHNSSLETGAVPEKLPALLQRAYEEAQRIYPDLAARDEALKKDAALHKITYPKPIAAEPPNYPPGSEYLGTQGTVYVAFVVRIDGQPRDIHVLFSPEKRMARSVLRAVEKWRFKPALIDGMPAEMIAVLPVEFALR